MRAVYIYIYISHPCKLLKHWGIWPSAALKLIYNSCVQCALCAKKWRQSMGGGSLRRRDTLHSPTQCISLMEPWANQNAFKTQSTEYASVQATIYWEVRKVTYVALLRAFVRIYQTYVYSRYVEIVMSLIICVNTLHFIKLILKYISSISMWLNSEYFVYLIVSIVFKYSIYWKLIRPCYICHRRGDPYK